MLLCAGLALLLLSTGKRCLLGAGSHQCIFGSHLYEQQTALLIEFLFLNVDDTEKKKNRHVGKADRTSWSALTCLNLWTHFSTFKQLKMPARCCHYRQRLILRKWRGEKRRKLDKSRMGRGQWVTGVCYNQVNFDCLQLTRLLACCVQLVSRF